MNTFFALCCVLAAAMGFLIPSVHAGLGLRESNPPCRQGQTSGCDSSRIVPCGTISQGSADLVIGQNVDLTCAGSPVDPYQTGDDILVQFDGSEGCLEILMKSGECWGQTPSGNYDCLGRCGAGCSTGGGWFSCSNWGPSCLQHDVCSYYYSASGGSSDPNCGDEFGYAVDDTLNSCLWSNACGASDSSSTGSSTSAICE